MTRIPVGEVIEWLAGCLFVRAAALWGGLVLALAVAGAFLAYQAQCFSGDTISVGTDNKEKR